MNFHGLIAGLLLFFPHAMAAQMKVGSAKIDVSPEFPVVLAGYAGRPGEFTGKDTPLFARAIVLGDENPLVLVAIDNCGAAADFGDRISAKLKEQHGITRERFVVAFTHTHNAPNLKGYAEGLWGPNATEKQWSNMDRYTQFLEEKVVQVVGEALQKRLPATLEWNQGRAHFGGNRRLLANGRWAGFGFQQDAPVDHSVPTLVARNEKGAPIAIWTSYACHCTTPGGMNRLHWDWAGAASHHIEAAHPGATALVTIGCGADVGPQPSGTTQFADDHGKELAAEATRLLGGKMKAIKAVPVASRHDFGLPLAKLPSREELEQKTKANPYVAYNARHQLTLLNRNGKLAQEVPYSITTWKFGDELAMIFLNGEVCVDYAVRLKKELDWQRIWITGWANDVPGYIPSKRVLQEGGYEPDDSMNFYLKPTRFADEVEELLITKVKQGVEPTFARRDNTPEPDFLKLPGRDVMLKRYLKGRFSHARFEGDREQLKKLQNLAKISAEGFGRLVTNEGEDDVWFDSTGGSSSRPFIRQLKKGTTLTWEPKESSAGGDTVTYVFGAGSGYLSEPKTEGFGLLVNGDEIIRFDVSNKAAEWKGADGKSSLFFFPTWNSDQDGAGLYYLAIPRRGKIPQLSVRSLGENSRRWFALEKTSAKQFEQQLLEAAGTGLE